MALSYCKLPCSIREVSLNEEIFKKTICESAVAQQMASSYAVQYVSELMLGFVVIYLLLLEG